MSERFLTPAVDEALDRVQRAIEQRFSLVGPWLDIHFVAANTPRDVQHALDEIPTGYQVILEVGGHVRGANIMDWTKDLAFLQADAVNTRARLRFVVTREDPSHA